MTKAPVTRRDATERIAELEDYIAEICDIYMELPLRIQDRWVEVMTKKGLYTPDEDEEDKTKVK